ncbi:MAG TPA: hypothetical protein PKU97_07050, partial [Kofleriaceae bacterium]|nr:hypothetical protein [Kofleriaceae bacterium]
MTNSGSWRTARWPTGSGTSLGRWGRGGTAPGGAEPGTAATGGPSLPRRARSSSERCIRPRVASGPRLVVGALVVA